MAPTEYSFEVRERAKELYVVDGCTFDQVGAATGVSLSQLKRWSSEEKEWEENRWSPEERAENEQKGVEGKDWPAARKEFRLALGSIRRDSTLLRAKLITQALDNPEFKRVLAAGIWEKTQAHKDLLSPGVKQAVPETSAGSEVSGDLPVIKTPQDAVTALEGLMARKFAQLTEQPGLLTFAAIKDLKQCLGLIEELKGKYKPDEKTGQAPGLSAETADEIRRKILGIQ
ncbi:MAG: DUF1804 family protein [Deltaproteobacteria bacterium]|nr:DUF1804 family protein [Deltaproteobacteria bacterium]